MQEYQIDLADTLIISIVVLFIGNVLTQTDSVLG